jgi:hypothetical protein
LKELLTSIGQLMALQKLNSSGSFELKELPTCIDQLMVLQELNLLGTHVHSNSRIQVTSHESKLVPRKSNLGPSSKVGLITYIKGCCGHFS